MPKPFMSRTRPMFSGWHHLTTRGHPIAGRRYRGLLWLNSVRKIGEGKLRHRFDVRI